MTLQLLEQIYMEIGDLTPLHTDCGMLCNAACCSTDDDGQGGVALLPGEDTLLRRADFAEITHDPYMDRPMLMCKSGCDRSLRPFLCRIFPLCPVIGKNGKWTVRMDVRSAHVCPLYGSGLRGLDSEFTHAVVRSIRLLAEDPEGEAFLRRWSDIESQFRKPLW